MLINRDFKITYANEASKAILTKHREHVQKLSRDFDPEHMIGTCIDVFPRTPPSSAASWPIPRGSRIAPNQWARYLCAVRERHLRRERRL